MRQQLYFIISELAFHEVAGSDVVLLNVSCTGITRQQPLPVKFFTSYTDRNSPIYYDSPPSYPNVKPQRNKFNTGKLKNDMLMSVNVRKDINQLSACIDFLMQDERLRCSMI